MQNTDQFQIQFLGVFITNYFSRVYNPIPSHHFQHNSIISFLAFQRTFTFLIFLNTSFTLITSDVVSKCPNIRNLRFIISEIVSASLNINISTLLPSISIYQLCFPQYQCINSASLNINISTLLPSISIYQLCFPQYQYINSWLVRKFHMPFSLMGHMFLSAFSFPVLLLFSALLLIVHTSEPYITADIIIV